MKATLRFTVVLLAIGVLGCNRKAPITTPQAPEYTPTPPQRQAVDRICAVFGKVNRDQFDYGTKPVTVVDFSSTLGTKITDEHLKYLVPLTDLEELDLRHTEVTGTGFAKLAGLKRLRKVRLAFSKITDEGLVQLVELPGIAELDVGWTEITDAGLERICTLSGLEVLDIHGAKEITDQGLAHLKELTKLRELHVGYPNISDRGVEHLRGLASLEILHLGGENVTDEGLAKLRDLKRLRVFSLETRGTTDDGIAELATWPALRDLHLSGGLKHLYTDAATDQVARLTNLEALKISLTQITNAGVGRVTKALPHLRSLAIGANKFITGASLKSVAQCQDLETLDLYIMEGVTTANLAYLRDLKKLRVLNLCVSHKPDITDEGLAHVAGLTALENLDLFSQEVTDTGLVHLEGLTALRVLDVRSTKVTAEGTTRLKKKLPKLKLVGEPSF